MSFNLSDLFKVKNKKAYTAADVYNATAVQRWHSTNVHRKQTVAEHTFTVTMLTRMLLDVINPEASCEDKLLANDYALWHDMPETATGDPSTPLKRILEVMFKGLSESNESPFEHIEKELCPQYAQLADQIKGSYLARIVKMADILDAQKFISIEGKGRIGQKIGDERNEAFKDLLALSKDEFPDYRWDAAYEIAVQLQQGDPVSIDFVENF